MTVSSSNTHHAECPNEQGFNIASVNSKLIELPKLLKNYKSEYEYIFSELYRFAESQSPTYHEGYTAPNMLRKYLEAYLGFKKPNITTWHEKLDLLFDTPELRREIHKFADDASQLQSLGRVLHEPAFVSSAQRCVKSVLDALRLKDEGHYSALKSIINQN